jgi:hypothetical protein
MQSKRVNSEELMDARLTRALERKPAVDVPADFAVRVAQQVPLRGAVRLPTARYGPTAMRVGMAVLVVVLVAVATRSSGQTVLGVMLEWILCAELVALAVWLGGVWRPMES